MGGTPGLNISIWKGDLSLRLEVKFNSLELTSPAKAQTSSLCKQAPYTLFRSLSDQSIFSFTRHRLSFYPTD